MKKFFFKGIYKKFRIYKYYFLYYNLKDKVIHLLFCFFNFFGGRWTSQNLSNFSDMHLLIHNFLLFLWIYPIFCHSSRLIFAASYGTSH